MWGLRTLELEPFSLRDKKSFKDFSFKLKNSQDYLKEILETPFEDSISFMNTCICNEILKKKTFQIASNTLQSEVTE